MKKEIKDIDHVLIDYIENPKRLSMEEEKQIFSDASSVEEWERSFVAKAILKKHKVDPQFQYNQFIKKIERRQRKRHLLIVGGSIAAMLALFVSINLLSKAPDMKSSQPQLAQIEKESREEVQVVVNGQKMTLSEISNHSPRAKVDTTQGRISYSSDPIEIQRHEIVVPKGKQFQVDLPDGSQVWLNSNSRLAYNNIFQDERYVELTGEAYFEVKPSSIPFIVKNGAITTRVLGTAFNCSNYKCAQVALVSGSVEIVSGQSEKILKPGELGEVTNQGGLEVSKANLNEILAWRDQLFFFENASLETIVEHLGRYYDFNVIWQDHTLKEQYFKFWGKHAESLDTIIERLSQTNTVQFKMHGNTLVISH